MGLAVRCAPAPDKVFGADAYLEETTVHVCVRRYLLHCRNQSAALYLVLFAFLVFTRGMKNSYYGVA